jgi:hypothetical protein
MSSITTTATILGVVYTVLNLGSSPATNVRRWHTAIVDVFTKVNNLKDPTNGSVYLIMDDDEYEAHTAADDPDDPDGPQISQAKPTCPAYPAPIAVLLMSFLG